MTKIWMLSLALLMTFACASAPPPATIEPTSTIEPVPAPPASAEPSAPAAEASSVPAPAVRAAPPVRATPPSRPAAPVRAAPVAPPAAPVAAAASVPPAASGPAYSGPDPCKLAVDGDSPIDRACREGGLKSAKQAMKGMLKDARATGARFDCDDCHINEEDYAQLSQGTDEKFARLLAASRK